MNKENKTILIIMVIYTFICLYGDLHYLLPWH